MNEVKMKCTECNKNLKPRMEMTQKWNKNVGYVFMCDKCNITIQVDIKKTKPCTLGRF